MLGGNTENFIEPRACKSIKPDECIIERADNVNESNDSSEMIGYKFQHNYFPLLRGNSWKVRLSWKVTLTNTNMKEKRWATVY